MFICKLLPIDITNEYSYSSTDRGAEVSIQMWWIEDALSIGGVCQVIIRKAYP